jgi:uncharacterized membrane protein YhaH (DUF805 family)
VSFPEAVTTVLTKFADFSGRARRSEFWWWALAYVIGSIIVGAIDQVLGNKILGWIYILAALVPGLAVAARRLHDTDRSGWWLLLIIPIVIGWIVLLIFYIPEGTPGDNKYGPSPKALPGGGGYNPNPNPNTGWS